MVIKIIIFKVKEKCAQNTKPQTVLIVKIYLISVCEHNAACQNTGLQSTNSMVCLFFKF